MDKLTWKNIRADSEVIEKLSEHGKFGDSMNDILRRLLGMSPSPKYERKPYGTGTPVTKPVRSRAQATR